jgi:hypothetical protein
MSCSTRDINVTEGASTSLPNIPGFGVPISIQQPPNSLQPPSGQPEDLNSLIQKISLQLPLTKQYPNLSPSFSKDLSDAIYSLMEQSAPFLSSFKMLVVVMKLLEGILEVICALINPFTLFSAINKLFNEYLPEFLALYPATSMIATMLDILKIILALVDYILGNLTKLVNAIDKNLKMFARAVEKNDTQAIANISKKLTFLLCSFQNFLVAFSMLASIVQIIEDLINFGLKVPCQSGSSCCTEDVCPAFLQAGGISGTGALKYFNDVQSSNVSSIYIPGYGSLTNNIRNHMYQVYDVSQHDPYRFINMSNGQHIFFPTSNLYSATTPVIQAPYTMDIRLYYDPNIFGRTGTARYIRFKQCIVQTYAVNYIVNWDGSHTNFDNGMLQIAGGLGYEDDGTTVLESATSSGQATLENFIYIQPTTIASSADEVVFNSFSYTLTPGYEVLFGQSIIAAGCLPAMQPAKNAAAAQVNIPTPPVIPDLLSYQNILANEIDTLASNLNTDNLNTFNTNVTNTLNNLRSDVVNAMINGFSVDRYKSYFTLTPDVQWTGYNIIVTIILNDSNGNSVATNLPTEVSNSIISKLKIYNTFGEHSSITYLSPNFIADLSSLTGGEGNIKIAYDNVTFATITPSPTGEAPTIAENIQNYEFITNVEKEQHPRRTAEDTLS